MPTKTMPTEPMPTTTPSDQTTTKQNANGTNANEPTTTVLHSDQLNDEFSQFTLSSFSVLQDFLTRH